MEKTEAERFVAWAEKNLERGTFTAVIEARRLLSMVKRLREAISQHAREVNHPVRDPIMIKHTRDRMIESLDYDGRE